MSTTHDMQTDFVLHVLENSAWLQMTREELVICCRLLTLYQTISTLTNPIEKPFENIVGKGENAGNQHFSFSHNVFYPTINKFQFLTHFYIVVCKCFEFGQV